MSLGEVERDLRENPTAFDFFQAVRLLERLRADKGAPGDVGPAGEAVRFAVDPSLASPAAEIENIEFREAAPPRMTVNFMGLIGPLGVLPLHYTLQAAERRRAGHAAVADFYDIFHHRMISLFYRAWEKHRFAVLGEKDGSEPLREHLLDLLGLGLENWRELLEVPDDTPAFYAGLLGPAPRSALALEQLLTDFFGLPVGVEQFIGAWYPLEPGDQCELDGGGASSRLGLGAAVGDEVWDNQARVRVRLGPLRRERFVEFLPGAPAWKALRSLCRFFANEQFGFEVQLILERSDVPGCVLGADADLPQGLGWTTWIRSKPFDRDADDTVLRLPE